MSEKTESPRVALVTGASSGIGQATAIEFARRGYQVAVHYGTNENGARETLEKIRAIDHAQPGIYCCDVSDPEQVTQMAGDLLADFERLDVLVNNAGSLIARTNLAEMDYEFWRRVMATNLDSVFLVTRAFLPSMIQQKSGNIVNVASIAGRNGGGPGAAAYSAAKGALIVLSKSMAKELIQYGIHVNAVNPGVIDTPFHERFSTPEMIQRYVSGIPMARTGTASEVAKVIAFLASTEADYLLGECIEINGGQLMD